MLSFTLPYKSSSQDRGAKDVSSLAKTYSGPAPDRAANHRRSIVTLFERGDKSNENAASNGSQSRGPSPSSGSSSGPGTTSTYHPTERFKQAACQPRPGVLAERGNRFSRFSDFLSKSLHSTPSFDDDETLEDDRSHTGAAHFQALEPLSLDSSLDSLHTQLCSPAPNRARGAGRKASGPAELTDAPPRSPALTRIRSTSSSYPSVGMPEASRVLSPVSTVGRRGIAPSNIARYLLPSARLSRLRSSSSESNITVLAARAASGRHGPDASRSSLASGKAASALEHLDNPFTDAARRVSTSGSSARTTEIHHSTGETADPVSKEGVSMAEEPRAATQTCLTTVQADVPRSDELARSVPTASELEPGTLEQKSTRTSLTPCLSTVVQARLSDVLSELEDAETADDLMRSHLLDPKSKKADLPKVNRHRLPRPKIRKWARKIYKLAKHKDGRKGEKKVKTKAKAKEKDKDKDKVSGRGYARRKKSLLKIFVRESNEI